jgi:hypothetical protein
MVVVVGVVVAMVMVMERKMETVTRLQGLHQASPAA